MFIIVEVFVTVKYSKHEKNLKLKKKNQNPKIDPKWEKGSNIFVGAASSPKKK